MPRRKTPLSHTRAYTSYKKAKARCENPNDDNYPYYGGRGVRFLLPPFAEFFRAMGERPIGWEIDRINVYGDYTIENVRWAPPGKGQTRSYKRTAKTKKLWM